MAEPRIVRTRRAPIYLVPGSMTQYHRARDKRERVFHWLLRFHFSTASILLRLLGVSHRNSYPLLGRLLRDGVIAKVRVSHYSAGPLYVLTRLALDMHGHDDVLVHQYRPRVSKRLPHDLAVQRCTLALLADAADFAPARVLYHQQMGRMAEQIAIAEARLQRLTRTLADFHRAARAYVAELSGALVASDERALLERHRARIAHRADEIGIDALTAEAYPEDALSDALSSHRQTQMDTNKIKFPDVLITYHDEDILAVEVERSRSGTKRGSMKLVDSLLTHARSLEEGRWHRVRYACRTPQITERVSRCFAALGLEDYREAFQFTTEPALFH
ncbi:MAG: hypothetical protein ACREXS_18030 [Gammaproteobacteria bacterium]